MNDLELRASPPRRVLAVAVLLGLGGLLLLLAFGDAMTLWGRVILLSFGGGALWCAHRVWSATQGGLRLTSQGLFDLNGRPVALYDQIASVDRGTFAFKPSNGFLLRLKASGPRRWEPGLWWQFGRRIGVGGVTPSGPAKAMAEQIALRLAGAFTQDEGTVGRE